MEKQIIKTKVTPLVYLNKDTIVGYKSRYICFFSIEKNRVTEKIPIPGLTKKSLLLCHFPLLSRIFRIFPRAVSVNKHNVFFALKNKCYCLNLNTNELSYTVIYSTPLYFANFKDGVVFGDYLNNDKKRPVSIYYVEKGFDAPKRLTEINNIRHIHGIFKSNSFNYYYILCGDDEEEAGIAISDFDNNKEPHFIARGKQLFRSCFIQDVDNNLCYATDSPFNKNHIMIVNNCNFEDKHSFLDYDISGSVIYGTSMKKYVFFSTAVEYNLVKNSDGSNKRVPINGKRGGILSKFSSLLCVSVPDRIVKNIDSAKKDFLNIHYFGFGTFKFAYSLVEDMIVYYGYGLKNKKKKIYLINCSDI